MKNLLLFAFGLSLFISCNSDSNQIPNSDIPSNGIVFDWIVPKSEILGSNNPFPLALNPTYTLATDIEFISDAEQVALISFKNGKIRAYPYTDISTYEIINDEIDGIPFSLTYCPITESAVLFKREFNSTDTFVLRSSGYLYKENLVAVDEKTETYWSQFLLTSIKGKYQEEHLKTMNIVETTWKTVKIYFPESQVFTNTSVTSSKANNIKNYSNKSSNDSKDIVYGILEFIPKNNLSSVHIYNFSSFNDGITLKILNIKSKQIIVIGSSNLSFITSFNADPRYSYTALQDSFPNIMADSNGNLYNVFGIAVSGPDEGSQLSSPDAFFASFWAWESFYPSIIEES